MFKLIDKELYSGIVSYTYEIYDSDYDVIGKVMILVGLGRHDAGMVFNNRKVGPIDAYKYIESFRELLDNDYIDIDEPHDKIILAEIAYEDPDYLF